jgi:hypothetical protein
MNVKVMLGFERGSAGNRTDKEGRESKGNEGDRARCGKRKFLDL